MILTYINVFNDKNSGEIIDEQSFKVCYFKIESII